MLMLRARLYSPQPTYVRQRSRVSWASWGPYRGKIDGIYAVLLPYVVPDPNESQINPLKTLASPRGGAIQPRSRC